MIFHIRRNDGFSLLEVLVALFLITIALLGTAGMQAYGVKVTQGGQFRAQAVLLGADFMERVEANNVAAVAGNYQATLPITTSPPNCVITSCTPANMAAYDLDQFQQNLAKQLPAATATIAMAPGVAGLFVYTLTVNWQERSFKSKSSATASDAATESFSYTVSRAIYNRAIVV